MTSARAFLAALATLAIACGSDTVERLRVRFDDCTLDPEEVSILIFVISPADGGTFPGLQAGSHQEDGVAVSAEDIDVDPDGTLEIVLRVLRANHRIRDRFAVRLIDDVGYDGELAVQVLAGDDEGQQIGRLDGDAPRFRFKAGEEHTLDLPLTCLCNGLPVCGGTCDDPEVDPHCRPPRNVERFCHDGLNNDTDALRDCADPECFRRGPCAACDVEICDNGVDDDCDNLIDCGDDACASRALCEASVPEVCTNGADDDRDHLRDCLDPDCAEADVCTRLCTPHPEDCTNRLDDDCDLRVDCFDDQCARPERELDCDDGFDDDCDDRVDCADPDCYLDDKCNCEPTAAQERLVLPDGCHDGLDDDCDGDFDCDDSDCWDAAPEVCDDAVDNDCDGTNNCADDDCPLETATEICDDLFDNDCDGKVDCEDSDCLGGGRTEPAPRCGDFLDNDCDGESDCDDPDCADTQRCQGTATQ